MSKIRLYGDTSGFVELAAPDVSDDGVLVLPTAAQGILAANGGIGSNVVQTVKTDTFSASVAQGATAAITGLSATITPTSDTSLVLVLYTVTFGKPDNTAGAFATLLRGATAIYIGDADGSRTRASGGNGSDTGQTVQLLSVSGQFLDSPGTDTAVTYSLSGGHDRGSTDTIYVNRTTTDSNTSQFRRAASSITLIEVAA